MNAHRVVGDVATSDSSITVGGSDEVPKSEDLGSDAEKQYDSRTPEHHDDVEKGRPNAGGPPHRELEDDSGGQQERDINLIQFDGPDDPGNPMNWGKRYKWTMTGILAGMTFVTTFTSAIFSTAINATSRKFHVSTEVMTLGTSLFLVGFVFGPIVWGPLSEAYGRRVPLILGTLAMCLFQVGVAVAPNLYTIMICRFFAGVFGSAPLAVVGGALADFWDPVQRGITVGIYTMCTFIGPVAAPIIGGYIAESYLGWRWTEYIAVIMGLFFWTIAVVLLKETSHPVILQRRAKKIRFETRNWAIHAEADEKTITMQIILERYLTRPFRMLRQEPILCLIALYVGLVYGILYLFFTAFPISFQQDRGWGEGHGGLPFLSVTIGVIIGGLLNAHHSRTSFAAALAASTSTPETRLPPMILGGFLLPPGLFWWAWASKVNSPWPQIIAGVPMGTGILLILVNGLNYIVDVYKANANSAIAANTAVRALFGAVFPLFAESMYRRLGVPWATSLLGFLTLGMLPVPVLFWWYGSKVRKWSRFIPE